MDVTLGGPLGQLRAIHQLTTALHQADSPAAFYEEAVTAVVGLLGIERASLLLFDPDGVMRFKAWRGLSPGYRQAVEGHTPWTPDDVDAEPILVGDVEGDPSLADYLEVFRGEGIRALAFVPLVHRQRLVGKFMLYYGEPRTFTADEVVLADILAAHVTLALERRRAEEDLAHQEEQLQLALAAGLQTERESTARLASLQRVTAELSRAVTVADVADVVLGLALGELGARTGSLCLVDGDELDIAASRGYPDDVMTHWRRFALAAPLPASEAVRTGRAVFLRSPAERDERYPVFASSPVVGDDAFAMVPLIDREPIGCLVFGFPTARDWSGDDEHFYATLAGQCAAALSRARLFEQRTEIARTLQASLLPPELPRVPGLDLAARYVAGGAGVDVGGDFYDVFPLDDRRFVAVIGDVCGRGVAAATLAGLSRHAIRSAALTARRPAAILAHLNEILLRQSPDDDGDPRFCTAVAAVVDPGPDGSVALALAVAGHPLPLVRRADGIVHPVGTSGTLLGVLPDLAVTESDVRLAPGDALVCFTDGVTERHQSGRFFGDEQFLTTLAKAPDGADDVAAAVETAVVCFADGDLTDDMAVLVIRAEGQR